ncbi:MAG: AraC family transcriptional regulator [Sphingomonadales bacterium]
MDILSDILSLLEIKGTLYFRTSFRFPWGVEVPAYKNVARFHLAHRGDSWFQVEGSEDEIHLEQGDLIIFPHGASHTLRGQRGARIDTLDHVVEESGFTGKGVLVYGGNEIPESEVQLICGHLAFGENADHPLLGELPPYIHLKKGDEISNTWLDVTLKMLGSVAGRAQPGSDLIATKLAEIIFTQTVRSFLTSKEANRLVFRGLKDPQISRLLGELHKNYKATWSLEEMARVAGMSRTVFAERFKELMGMTPMQYLTNWRMQKARQRLTESKEPVIRVAEESGYQSEAAFARAFKQYFDVGPATYRKDHQEAA